MEGGSPPPGFGPGSPGYGPGGFPPPDEDKYPPVPRQPEAPGPQSPAPPPQSPGPQSPGPQSPTPPPAAPPYTPPAPPPRPEDPGAPPSPGYGGQVPPGGWQQSPVPTAPTGGQRAPLASWGSRLAAYVIDGIVVGIPASVLFFVLLGGASGVDDETGWVAVALGFLAWFLVVGLIVLLYAPLLMARSGEHNGQTWGKQLIGIRATRNNGKEWGFGSAALREVALKNVAVWIASFMIPVIPWFLNFFWPLWDDENRALHDMGAESHVVKA